MTAALEAQDANPNAGPAPHVARMLPPEAVAALTAATGSTSAPSAAAATATAVRRPGVLPTAAGLTAVNAGAFGIPSVWDSYFCLDGERCYVADANADGLDDFIVVTTGGNIWVARNIGFPGFSNQQWATSACASTDSCFFADVNNDHKADLVVFTRGTQHAAKVALSNGNSFGSLQTWSTYFST
jgi:VCBS repeat protein